MHSVVRAAMRGAMRGAMVVAGVVSLALPRVGMGQSAAESAYERVAAAWSRQQTLEARFDQKITNPLLGRTATSRGTFLQQKPDKVSITFTDPDGDRIVGDGRSLWVYLPSSTPGQVLKLPANADGAVVADLLRQLFDVPREAFTITGGDAVTVEGRATRRAVLTPKAGQRVAFSKATLWLDEREARPVRVQVIDGQGVDRTITLTSWSPNAELDRKAFVFSVPKGVKVVTKLPGM